MNLKATTIGIELGSTRIKAVLIDKSHKPIASGSYDWENQLVNGIWTYSLAEVDKGVRACFKSLKQDFYKNTGLELTTTGAIGVSGMMHGYLPFDKDWNQLAEFRTWRNTITGEAAAKLTEAFNFNVPQRWSIAHIYQAILNKEKHVKNVAFATTVAGYIHHKLTGVHAVGIGEASGMFPIDSKKFDYNEKMVKAFNEIIAKDVSWKIRDILPKVLVAGQDAGKLTAEGAKFLDPSGKFEAGIPLAPCEGDAGTGMAATNSVRLNTGNVSAGTSDFAMIVTDKKLKVHREIDMVTTPDGFPVAMVHCNNCTSDINAWAKLFTEFAAAMGEKLDKGEVFNKLFSIALKGAPDCGGLLSYNYFSGEGVTDFNEGRPVLIRKPDADFSLANFMRCNLTSALATLKIGLDILAKEKVTIETLYGHGGFFKTAKAGQTILSAAANAPVSVMETAGEGGPYGMALLAGYLIWKKDNENLADYLQNRVFAKTKVKTLKASEEEVKGMAKYIEAYKKGLVVEKDAIATL